MTDRIAARGVAASAVATMLDWIERHGGEPDPHTDAELHWRVNSYLGGPQETSDDPDGQGARDAAGRAGALIVELAGLAAIALHQQGHGKDWLDAHELSQLR